MMHRLELEDPLTTRPLYRRSKPAKEGHAKDELEFPRYEQDCVMKESTR